MQGLSLWSIGFSVAVVQTLGHVVVVGVGSGAWGMWDLSSPTKDPSHVPYFGRQVLKHRITRKVPRMEVFLTDWPLLICPATFTTNNSCFWDVWERIWVSLGIEIGWGPLKGQSWTQTTSTYEQPSASYKPVWLQEFNSAPRLLASVQPDVRKNWEDPDFTEVTDSDSQIPPFKNHPNRVCSVNIW